MWVNLDLQQAVRRPLSLSKLYGNSRKAERIPEHRTTPVISIERALETLREPRTVLLGSAATPTLKGVR